MNCRVVAYCVDVLFTKCLMHTLKQRLGPFERKHTTHERRARNLFAQQDAEFWRFINFANLPIDDAVRILDFKMEIFK